MTRPVCPGSIPGLCAEQCAEVVSVSGRLKEKSRPHSTCSFHQRKVMALGTFWYAMIL
jgi:hypothetical protein